MAFGRPKRTAPSTTTTNVTTTTTTTTTHPDGTVETKERKPSLMDKLRAKNSTSRTNPAPGTTTKPKRTSRLGRSTRTTEPVVTTRKPTMGEKMKAKMKGTTRGTTATY